MIGRALTTRGRWVFEPSKRGRRVPLHWRGAAAPEDGDYCIAEVDFEQARLVEVLGADDRPEWDDPAVASQYRLRQTFDPAAEREAETFSAPGPRELRGRLDLRERLVFTIDPEDARDHDDALHWAALGHGRHEVGIHIADVSHYVTPDSALDREARARGLSCYLPGGVIPMLPQRLSADLCSLREGQDRLALSVLVELDERAGLHGVKFAETVVRSAHRLTYPQVQAAWEGQASLPAPVLESLERLRSLARGLRSRRWTAGALDLDVPEVKAWVDERGVPVKLERRPHLESHELVEEFMLLANRCVGHEGSRRRAGMLYRVHEPPGPPKLAELDAMLRALGLPRMGPISEPARALQALLQAPLDPPRRRLVHRLVLRALARARYSELDLGHFGLAAREYCHFTSPIRRYPDLHNHRRVREWLHGRRSAAWDPPLLQALAEACTASEQNATDAEREAVRVKALRVAEGRLGESHSGIITGLIPQGCFVELEEIPVEGFCRPGRDLDDHFTLDSSGVRLVGRRTRRRFSLGDTVRVTVARVDVPARECDLAIEVPSRRHGRRHRGGL
jgi:ribonuclease R